MISKYPVHHRSACRICGSSQLHCFLELPNMPMTDDFLRRSELGSEFLYPINVYVCCHCGVSQTLHDVDMRDYYRKYEYTVAQSGFATRFMQKLAEETWRRFGLRNGDAAVEVGSGDGAQLRAFREVGAKVFGIEPSALLAQKSREAGIMVSQQLFGSDAEASLPHDFKRPNVILLTYTFDHLPNPVEFLNCAQRILHPDRGVLIIEVHDLDRILERQEYCLFEHEHTCYYTAATMQRMLDNAGLKVLSTTLLPESIRRGNSLLVVAAPAGSALASEPLPLLAQGEASKPHYLDDCGRRITCTIENLGSFIEQRYKDGKKLAGYGAGGRGVMTLAAVKPANFEYVCDKNTAFHGFLTPGAHVRVTAPDTLLSEPVDEVIVFSFGYFDEIFEELGEFRRRGSKLINLLDLISRPSYAAQSS